MKNIRTIALPALLLTLLTAPALADEKIKGYIEAVNHKQQTIDIDGITVHVNDETRLEGVDRLEDLVANLRVKVKYYDEGDNYYATKIELKDIKGLVEAIDAEKQSFVVDGMTFYATEDTHYDNGLESFDDLEEDVEVEVEFYIDDGKFYAIEVELED